MLPETQLDFGDEAEEVVKVTTPTLQRYGNVALQIQNLTSPERQRRAEVSVAGAPGW